jgi:hypothetical protein
MVVMHSNCILFQKEQTNNDDKKKSVATYNVLPELENLFFCLRKIDILRNYIKTETKEKVRKNENEGRKIDHTSIVFFWFLRFFVSFVILWTNVIISVLDLQQ